MKKYLSVCLAFLLLLSLSACAQKEEKASETLSPTVVRTFEEGESGDDHIWVAYYEMSDGTWRTDAHTYQYCLVLEGDFAQITVLSNREDVTYDEAFKASLAYFDGDELIYFGAEETIADMDFELYFEILSFEVDDAVFKMPAFSLDVTFLVDLFLKLGLFFII